MARTRKTSKEALEEKIEKAEADVIAAKKKFEQNDENGENFLGKREKEKLWQHRTIPA